jgi:hypothetical protein
VLLYPAGNQLLLVEVGTVEEEELLHLHTTVLPAHRLQTGEGSYEGVLAGLVEPTHRVAVPDICSPAEDVPKELGLGRQHGSEVGLEGGQEGVKVD